MSEPRPGSVLEGKCFAFLMTLSGGSGSQWFLTSFAEGYKGDFAHLLLLPHPLLQMHLHQWGVGE
jgi:hypothetical protein